MKNRVLRGLVAAVVAGFGLLFVNGAASAGESFRVSVHSPHVAVSYGKHDGHRYDRRHRYVYRERHYDHGRDHRYKRGRGHDKYHRRYERRHGHGVYRHHARTHATVVYRSGHHRHRAPDRHVCRYERRPVVTKHYYDRCGNPVYYTDYVTVRACKRYHH